MMPHPVTVAVSCHARGQILPSLLQHRWWYLSWYLKWGRNAPSRVSSNSLDVVSCPLRVKIAAGHIISDLFIQFPRTAVWECWHGEGVAGF